MKSNTWLWLIIGTLTLARFGISTRLNWPREAYWLWSQELSLGYFDHPPVIAYAIRLGTEILGHTEQGVRLITVLLGGVAAWLCATAPPVEHRHSDQALRTALTLSVLPLFALGGILATPDVPLAAAWALGIWAAARNRSVLLGIACGLAMLSKYTGLLLLPCILLSQPHRFRQRNTWFTVVIAALVYLPNALWNLQHDLISWRFQIAHAAEGGRQLDFLGAQIGLVSPFLFLVFLAWWCVGWRGSQIERLCWWTAVPVLVIALVSGGEANWAAPAYVSTAVGVGCRMGQWRLASWVSTALALLMSSIFLIHMINPIFDIRGDPRARLIGGKTLAQAVDAWNVPMVVTSRYQEAGWISFYGQTTAVALPDHSRLNQFDIWPTELPAHTLYVRVADGERPPAILSRGYHSLGVHEVRSEMQQSDPSITETIRRWQLFEVMRTETNP